MIGKALVCDDSSADLINIKNIVEGVGYSVSVATDGGEAIDKAKEMHPDIIFLDIIMPQMDGYETCRRLTDDPETRNIPVVFVTSKNQKASPIEIGRFHATCIIIRMLRLTALMKRRHRESGNLAHRSTSSGYVIDFRCGSNLAVPPPSNPRPLLRV